MWLSKVWKLANEHRLFAGIIVAALLLAVTSVLGGAYSPAKYATETLKASWSWFESVSRNTEKAKAFEDRIKVVERRQDALDKKVAASKARMHEARKGTSYKQPDGATELRDRFRRDGFSAEVR